MNQPLTFIAIIPARFASSRFPGKPLAEIGGRPMIERVYTNAVKALGEDNVAVATDDARIFSAVEAFGGRPVMTSQSHRSGTDRIREAYDLLGSHADVVVNIQGDEPFVDSSQILSLTGCFADPHVQIATLARPFEARRGYEALADPNTPKVVVSSQMDALMFSRQVIPHLRGVSPQEWPARHQYLTHVGMYAYRADVLRRITSLLQTPLELAESLEQLRWLENGIPIRVALTDRQTIGIDTHADLEAARQWLAQHPDPE